jgi:membrane protease YdiL (CAAX protease family)
MNKIIFSLIIIFWIAFPISFQIRNIIRGGIILRIVRILSMSIPYLAIFLILPLPYYNFSLHFKNIGISVGLAVVYVLFDLPNIRRSLNKELIPFLDKVEAKHLISRLGEVVIIPAMEEIFFRGIIPINRSLQEISFVFCISTLLFNIAHYVETSKEIVYHIKLVALSIIALVIYFYTRNLIYSIVFHMLCNIPWLLINIKIYWYGKNIKKEK